MKTKKNPEPLALALGPSDARAALIAVLDQFHLPLEQFLRQRTTSYEHRVAAHSIVELHRLYDLVTRPGKSQEDAALEAPVWPSGKLVGRQPQPSTLGRIKKRLLPPLATATKAVSESEKQKRQILLENKKTRFKEEKLQLRNKEHTLDQNKFDHQLAADRPAQPALPVSEETADEMIERAYGYNPLK